MIEAITSGTTPLLILAGLVGLIAVVMAIRIAIKLAIRVAVVAAVVLAALYAAGVVL